MPLAVSTLAAVFAKTSELFEHAQRYIREVFASRLREEGFSSYKGDDIHWYRLINNEVVHAVYFTTRHAALGAFMTIQYGCHPLFIPPIFQKSPYLSSEPGYEQMLHRIPEPVPNSTEDGIIGTHLWGEYNRPYRYPDSLIMCPDNDNKGLDVLEMIFPVIDAIKTPDACYEMHKKMRKRQIENDSSMTMSSYFVDEMLFWEDHEVYEYCRKYVEHMMYYQNYIQNMYNI